ncbi:hypothetical protein [Aneurinibacillus migulanus]|uniref:hypothetical protein n=1 Tax=Aneurinibacillus migulanus TaxID=47500 RepID=UPI0020A0E321|nr:hypothetical protein [Aneurinibacillus migulanus]MCP1354620.1 hypothetical protein [Aneurinibacillus migulanus]
MRDVIKVLVLLIVGVVVMWGLLALFGWATSVLVSFIFDINFGFWKGVALVALCILLFGGRGGGKSE